MTITEQIKQKALEIGFDLVGITDAAPIDSAHAAVLTDWLEAGLSAEMLYMHRNLQKRINPSDLLDGATSVIVVGLNYTSPHSQQNSQSQSAHLGKVAAYAQYEDYHPFIKNQLRQLVAFITLLTGIGIKFKICVDAAPVAERSLAARAGLGFIGKNHMLISPKFGCQILLGEIITSLKLDPDKPFKGDCADCDRCIRACPTGALRPDGRFNAARCISYLTTEHKADIDSKLAEKISDRLFGCDCCSVACPYQLKAPPCSNAKFKFYPDRGLLDLNEILQMTEDDFEGKFADSCFIRLGLERLKRNAHLCLENLTSNTEI